ncbi:Uu.00g029090.m01.CDS01 [Anthostomella pinea]|uniref:Uu.00g029090.m01.CDS01 n=1 Tax=Anthostomella pinea TaxID=933095 RepID=A0AAI8YCS1_9PEZI|nr:Uu.00g029090.m01.CDS01 [Anthostomella pinea]
MPSHTVTKVGDDNRTPAKPSLFGFEFKSPKLRRFPKAFHRGEKTVDATSPTVLQAIEDARKTIQSEQDSGYGSFSTDSGTTKVGIPKVKFSTDPVPKDVQDRFCDVRLLFGKALLNAVSSKQDISLKPKCTDPDRTPYIVVQCDKRIVKKVKKFFDQSHVQEALGDFQIHVAPGLRQLATSELKVYGDHTTQRTLCGMRIKIESDQGSSMATLGGLIAVTRAGHTSTYGLTAGHAVSRLISQSASAIEDNIDAFSDSSDDDEYDEIANTDEDGVVAQTQATISAAAPEIGTITEHSFQSVSSSINHDWALVKFKSHVVTLALQCSAVLLRRATENPTNLRMNVAVMTARGFQRGTVASSSSCLLVAPSEEFVDTYDFIADEGFCLQAGDSGSWVIHELTRNVYGHVVSIDMFGETYVMPLAPTPLDIETHLLADRVCLPLETNVIDAGTMAPVAGPRTFDYPGLLPDDGNWDLLGKSRT